MSLTGWNRTNLSTVVAPIRSATARLCPILPNPDPRGSDAPPLLLIGFLREPLLLQLEAWLASERARDKTSALGVMAGHAWAGPKQDRGPALEALRAALVSAAPEVRGLRWNAWPVVLGDGGRIDWHDHHQAEWSAVAYLRVPPGSGRIVFEQGPVAVRRGDVLLFRGRDQHAVKPGAGERWSVAVNFYRD